MTPTGDNAGSPPDGFPTDISVRRLSVQALRNTRPLSRRLRMDEAHLSTQDSGARARDPSRDEAPRRLIEIAGLGKTYGDQVALADIAFAAAPGEVVGLIGPNGAGK